MSTRKARSLANRARHAQERAAVLGKSPPAPAVDPLDEEPMPAREPLAPIPWNKVQLTEEGRRAVADALLDGYPRNQIAKALGTTVRTLARLIKENPDLADAVDVRRDAEEAELKELLTGMARRGDTVAAIFLAKAQFGWRDRDDGKGKGELVPGGVLVVPGTASLEEWSAAAFSQQARHRERPTDDPRQPELRRPDTDCGEVRMRRPRLGEKLN